MCLLFIYTTKKFALKIMILESYTYTLIPTYISEFPYAFNNSEADLTPYSCSTAAAGIHLSLHLLSNLLDLGLTVHGQQVQLLVYEFQSILTVLFGLQAVDPTRTHTHKHTHTHILTHM